MYISCGVMAVKEIESMRDFYHAWALRTCGDEYDPPGRKSTSLNDLRSAALAMPFLTERRLVIVEDALQPYKGPNNQKAQEELITLLDSLPQTTALVLIIPDSRSYKRGEWVWEILTKKHWLMKWVDSAKGHA